MPNSLESKKWKKIAKIFIGALTSFILVLLFFPLLFHGWISEKVSYYASEYLTSELQFEDSRLTFFRHFPSATLSMEDVTIYGSGPYSKAPFISAKTLDFTISIWRILLTDEVALEKFDLDKAQVSMKVDRFGRPNYGIFKSSKTPTDTTETTSPFVTLKGIKIQDVNISYIDDLRNLDIQAKGFSYDGAGNFKQGQLSLGSEFEIAKLDVIFEDVAYLKDKHLKASISSVYNDNTASVSLDKNDLQINSLLFSLTGKIDFDPKGFHYEAEVSTTKSHLSELLSLLPPNYQEWRKKTNVDGLLDAKLHMSGFQNGVSDSLEHSKIDLRVQFKDGTLQYKETPEPIENILVDADLKLENDQFEIQVDTLSFTLEDDFSRGHFYAKGTQNSFNLKTRLHTQLNLHLLQESLQLPDLHFGGHLVGDINASGVYDISKKLFPITDAEIQVTDGYLKTSFPDPIEKIFIDFKFRNKGGRLEDSAILLEDLSFMFEDNPFDLKFMISNLEQPDYTIQAKGSLDLKNFTQVTPLPYISGANGFIRLDALFKGRAKRGKAGGKTEFDVESNSGTLFLENVVLESKVLLEPFEIIHGDFTFKLDRLEFSDFELKYANNYAILNGYFTNYIPYFIVPNAVLEGDFDVQSDRINLNDLIPSEPLHKVAQTDSLAHIPADSLLIPDEITGVLQVSKNISFKLNVDIDTLAYMTLKASNFKGQVTLTKGGLLFNDTRMDLVGGTASMQGYYRPNGNNEAFFDFKLLGKNLDIKRAYNEIDLFRDLVPAAEKANGIVSLDYEVKGSMDKTMQPILPSLEGSGVLNAKHIQFENYKLFGTVSKQTRIGALNNPKMEQITIVSKIDNNLLEMERFKFKVHPFLLRMEGQTTLDGDLDLQMRLGLPPFGLVGIPIKITGVSDSLKIKVGLREKDLRALDYDDDSLSKEERLRFLMLRDSITEQMNIEEIKAFETRMDSIYFRNPNLPKTTDSIATGISKVE
ncbi:hypothetical protein KO493_08020 [Tamlana agarivorans]|uniref:Uncharacterized protein n=1 Tax=Pseudotamlana agarivorans TaxID=481183 RepID=A0ACC5U8K5_9FLAO|nr:AsmA-like C-terminal region-containing protein [Tamlana agarivorans]MBU2950639.1 hypothetical protein [Tamlana agarivorans]